MTATQAPAAVNTPLPRPGRCCAASLATLLCGNCEWQTRLMPVTRSYKLETAVTTYRRPGSRVADALITQAAHPFQAMTR
jgi:hypothetical protein